MARPRRRFRSRRRRSPLRKAADYLLTGLLVAAALWGLRQWGGFGGGNIRVIDGDSLIIDGREVRLSGIDAVELHQDCLDPKGRPWPCGRLARNHLRTLVMGQRLDCKTIDVDKYGRTVAVCRAGDEDIGLRMIADGWAVPFIAAPPAYYRAAARARAARFGIWHGRFTRPAEWRARQRALHGDAASMTERRMPPD
jgi:endonuclease YncB( thermonuclease family)